MAHVSIIVQVYHSGWNFFFGLIDCCRLIIIGRQVYYVKAMKPNLKLREYSHKEATLFLSQQSLLRQAAVPLTANPK